MKLLVLILLISCSKAPEKTDKVNKNFEVETLFTVDGCTVYRFVDYRTVYFTNCNGSTTYINKCGKNCTEQIGVD